MDSILVVGYFGYLTNQLDGQTIKTRNILNLIKSNSNMKVEYFDTQNYQNNKWLLFKTFYQIGRCKICIYLPAHKNLYYLFPIIFFISKLCNTKIIYPVIGGWLADYLRRKRIHALMLRYVNAVLVESVSLKEKLSNSYRFRNVEWFPNFRIHNFSRSNFHMNTDTSKIRIVFMGRIIVEKGVDVIFRLADFIYKSDKQNFFEIDFYGPIIDGEYFESKIGQYQFVNYKGVLENDNIYKSLSLYDLLLLPTRYEGEGFPGAIIDAYISGIPVICSDWKYLKEFVISGKTGYVYDLNKENDMYDIVLKISESPILLQKLKQQAKEESKKYSSDVAWSILCKYL